MHSYDNILNETINLYKAKKYREAYEFVTDHMDVPAGNIAQLYNFRYSIASVMGDKELALNILNEAVMEKGYWYSASYLKSDADLKPLHEMEGFAEVVARCQALEEEAKAAAKVQVEVTGKAGAPLYMVLHGNQHNNEITKFHWTTDVHEDFLMAFIQSSQMDFSDAYVWNDEEKGLEDVAVAYETLRENHGFDENDVTIAGFSAGAGVALRAVMSGTIKVDKVVLYAPWIEDFEFVVSNIFKLKKNPPMIYIACGEDDEDSLDVSDDLAELLDKAKIDYEYAVIDNLAHEYPEHFDSLLNYTEEYFRK